MEVNSRDLRLSYTRRPAGCIGGHATSPARAGATLDETPRNRWQIAGADPVGARLGHCPRLSARREPGTLEGAPRHASAAQIENCTCAASPGNALHRVAKLHGGVTGKCL